MAIGSSSDCADVGTSFAAAYFAKEGLLSNTLDGYLVTSFHRGLVTDRLEPYITGLGSDNNFFGIPVSPTGALMAPRPQPPVSSSKTAEGAGDDGSVAVFCADACRGMPNSGAPKPAAIVGPLI